MPRYLANKVIADGSEHRLAVVDISDDGLSCCITPFTAETEATRWVDGTLVVDREPQSGRYVVKKIKNDKNNQQSLANPKNNA